MQPDRRIDSSHSPIPAWPPLVHGFIARGADPSLFFKIEAQIV